MNRELPSGGVFARRAIALSWIFSMPALAMILPMLYSLLELSAEEWRYFFILVFGYLLVASFPLMALQRRLFGAAPEYLDARRRGAVSHELARRAFADTMDLPRRFAAYSSVNWLVPVSLIALAMELRWSSWGAFESFAVVLSGIAAGLVAGTFVALRLKRATEPLRSDLAGLLEDPDERAALVHRTPLLWKLTAGVASTAIAPVIFAVLLFQAEASRSLEDFTLRWVHGLLESVGPEHDGADAGARASRALAKSVELSVVDTAREDGPLERDVLLSLRAQLAAGAELGDSRSLPSERVLAWRRLENGQVLLAGLPMGAARVDTTHLWTVFGLLLIGAGAVALGLAYLLARDLAEATERLREGAERLASGDLRPGEVFESEDELGDLGRAFARMSSFLRSTVSRVAGAGVRVEERASDMAEVAASLAAVTADQVSGIERTAQSMDAIDRQVRGIAESAQALNISVEESSSSILELGAAGHELNETASVLSDRVNEVSHSIEDMVSSVRRVLENTESLSEAAVETSSSMEEMASSMRQVDESAEEAGELSRGVVSAAESGQRKMVQAIDGMNEIRDATDEAERVVRGLGTRASEIGAIVDVIDGVADETNLLALNAAIIAAQAGEHGRAFGVVADEIKDLADRVLASTKEIGGLIRAVQSETSNAVGAIEKGASSVASGVDLTAEAGVSLEQITRSSRSSGERIAGIVSAVREQAKATVHVAELMERVRAGVEQIREAATEQDRGNEVVSRSSAGMRDVATQVRGTTEEQARGSGRIRESIEGVRVAVEQINGALQEQATACRAAVEVLEAVHGRTRANEESAQRLDGVTRDLVSQAEALREEVGRFRLG